jgi:hypothetical protein
MPFINDMDLYIEFRTMKCELTISMDVDGHSLSIIVDYILDYAWKQFGVHALGNSTKFMII